MTAPRLQRQFDDAPPSRWLNSDRRYYTGWWMRDEGEHPQFEAYLRPDSSDWYDLFPAPTWWEAMAEAMHRADETGAMFEGRHVHGLA